MFSATVKISFSLGSITTWTRSRSFRKSMKITPPWSLTFSTHPLTVAVFPSSEIERLKIFELI